jgi:hypothetical protein
MGRFPQITFLDPVFTLSAIFITLILGVVHKLLKFIELIRLLWIRILTAAKLR